MRSLAYEWFVRGVGLALGLALVGVLLAVAVFASRAIVLVFIALLLGTGLQPLVEAIRARVPIGRVPIVLAVYGVFILVVVGLVVLVTPAAISQLGQFSERVAPLLASAREWATSLQPRALAASMTSIVDFVGTVLKPRAADLPGPDELIQLGVSLADLGISLIAVLAMVFFWLTERPQLQRFGLALLPQARRASAHEAWNEIEYRLGAWVRGQLLLMGSVGVMATVAYFLIGLPEPLLLGLIAALFEALPLIGPALGAIPALAVAMISGDLGTVALVAVVYVIIQTFESNVLVPVVMRNAVGVPAFLVIVAVLAGAAMAGVIGALLAVPVMASLVVVAERLQARAEPVGLDRDGGADRSV
jgi:predicted PurR-regulated permease PerM